MRTQKQIMNIMKNMLTLLIYWCKSKKDGKIPIKEFLPFFEDLLIIIKNCNNKKL